MSNMFPRTLSSKVLQFYSFIGVISGVRFVFHHRFSTTATTNSRAKFFYNFKGTFQVLQTLLR